jgi:hypothetical protein
MEIRHAVLNDPGTASAFFYFRSAEYSAPDIDPDVLREPSLERAARMASLKDEIRVVLGHVVREYSAPSDAAALLRGDLEELIETRFPVNPLVERTRTIHWQKNLADPHAFKGTPAGTFEELRLKERTFSDSLLPLLVERTR